MKLKQILEGLKERLSEDHLTPSPILFKKIHDEAMEDYEIEEDEDITSWDMEIYGEKYNYFSSSYSPYSVMLKADLDSFCTNAVRYFVNNYLPDRFDDFVNTAELEEAALKDISYLNQILWALNKQGGDHYYIEDEKYVTVDGTNYVLFKEGM